jgi:hypothetical protein
MVDNSAMLPWRRILLLRGATARLHESVLVGLGLLAHHDNRALGMSRDVLAYRSQEHPGEPAVAAGADHDQIGVPGEVDEQFRRAALLDLRMYEDRRILAEDVPNRFHQQLLRRLPGIGCSVRG